MERTRYVLILAAAATVFVGARGTASAQFVDQSKVYTVTATRLNVRTGPSTRNRVVGQLLKGRRVYAHRIANGWAEITFQGARRHTSARFLTRSSTPTTPSSSPSPSTPGGPVAAATYEVSWSRLNVRTGPSTSFRVVTTLSQGARMRVTRESGSWKGFMRSGQLVWAHGSGLRRASATPPPAAPSPSPAPSSKPGRAVAAATYEVSWSRLNVRTAPSTSSRVVTTLSRGARMRVTRESGSWKGYTRSGQLVWAYGGGLKRAASSPTPSPSPRPSTSPAPTRPVASGRSVPEYQRVVRLNNSSLRATPAVSGTRLRTLPAGLVVRVIRTSGSYRGVKLSARGAFAGWVHDSLLRAPTPATPPQAVTETERGNGNRSVGNDKLGASCSRESVRSHSRSRSGVTDTTTLRGRVLGRSIKLCGARSEVRSNNSNNRVETKRFKLEVVGNEFTVDVGLEKRLPWFEDVLLWSGGLGPVGVKLLVEAGIKAEFKPRVAVENGGVSFGTVAAASVYGEGKVELDALIVRGGVKGTLNVVEVSLPSGYTLKLSGVESFVDIVISSNIGIGVYVIVGRKVFGIGAEKEFTFDIPFLQFTLAEVRIAVARGRVVGS